MTGPADPTIVRWRIHLASPPEKVYEFLATDAGRACFWAESAVEEAGYIHFTFPNGWQWRGRILENAPPYRFSLVYFGSTTTTFELANDRRGGTDLCLTDEGIEAADWTEVYAGWVSVLLALKAVADFGVDLRNHDAERSWDQGYADN
jgi:uncharacterized protein YndB with AHSA1/START domain